ncbi:MAG: 2-oxoacid:acceptor oxidoreductase family protein, partial [Patescibacteria group bacterium]|nr:2-oxoacid:acceptor oxidoreductase family protein [Patescibacteria group bacterium]
MIKKDFSILIGGKAGEGSRKAGLVIAKLFTELGYKIFIYDDYQSLIRGGHNFSHIRAADKKILSHREKLDFLLGLNKDVIEKHKNKLDKNGIIIQNSEAKKAVEEVGGKSMMENTALIAIFAKNIGIEWKLLEKVLKEEFKKFQKLNLKVAQRAFDKAEILIKVKKLNKKGLPLMTGNEALALGAVKAGLDLYLAYPMTPATGILHYLAENKDRFKVVVSQLENEVGIVNAAVGAVYAG